MILEANNILLSHVLSTLIAVGIPVDTLDFRKDGKKFKLMNDDGECILKSSNKRKFNKKVLLHFMSPSSEMGMGYWKKIDLSRYHRENGSTDKEELEEKYPSTIIETLSEFSDDGSIEWDDVVMAWQLIPLIPENQEKQPKPIYVYSIHNVYHPEWAHDQESATTSPFFVTFKKLREYFLENCVEMDVTFKSYYWATEHTTKIDCFMEYEKIRELFVGLANHDAPSSSLNVYVKVNNMYIQLRSAVHQCPEVGESSYVHFLRGNDDLCLTLMTPEQAQIGNTHDVVDDNVSEASNSTDSDSESSDFMDDSDWKEIEVGAWSLSESDESVNSDLNDLGEEKSDNCSSDDNSANGEASFPGQNRNDEESDETNSDTFSSFSAGADGYDNNEIVNDPVLVSNALKQMFVASIIASSSNIPLDVQYWINKCVDQNRSEYEKFVKARIPYNFGHNAIFNVAFQPQHGFSDLTASENGGLHSTQSTNRGTKRSREEACFEDSVFKKRHCF